ncbi:hypothetical protein PRK78_007468 [Emydomyces testavorans]|uniref:Lysine decarboxylase-like protein n=1 Tax=Emydomyces testavorans TaxID=2070801 RepID=A0AAF0DPD6_9EURO|nr:hypothetical protein PRK78_007468 [Emydomyces testavorans]
MATSTDQNQPVICVFCGSKPGNNPAYVAAARALAQIFHKANINLVYGGGTAGIMGELARTLVSLSGPAAVHGVIPSALVRVENGYKTSSSHGAALPTENYNNYKNSSEEGETEMARPAPERIVPRHSSQEQVNSEYGITTIVPDMHTRKRVMAEKVIGGGPGSGFVVLPGGFGTLEEAMEMVTWNQLGIHHRGIVLLNVDGYWDGIMDWVERAVEDGFVSEANSKILVECRDVEGVLGALRGYKLSEERYQLQWEGTREEHKPE